MIEKIKDFLGLNETEIDLDLSIEEILQIKKEREEVTETKDLMLMLNCRDLNLLQKLYDIGWELICIDDDYFVFKKIIKGELKNEMQRM